MNHVSFFRRNSRDDSMSQMMMAVLAIAVGVIAGLGAVIFRWMIDFVHNLLFLGQVSIAHYGIMHTPFNPWGWGVIFVPVIGAVGVAWLVKTFAPETRGSGVPEVLDAIYLKEGKIRPIVGFMKSLTSALSIGSGASVGQEGPIIQIGSAFGSSLGAIFSMPAWQRGILIAAGATGGIAATFNTPIGALAFGVELMLASVSAITLFPVVIATVTATFIGKLCLGAKPALYIPYLTVPHFHLLALGQLVLFVPFGVLLGFLSLFFIRGVYWFEDFFNAVPGGYYTRHITGMFTIGVLLYLMMRFSGNYYVEGSGYSTILEVMRGLILNPWFLLLLVFVKWLATCVTMGSGASGGIFSPSLFLGAAVGGAFGLFTQHVFPALCIDPAVFAIAGMAGMVSGTTGAVLTAVTMIPEMVGNSADIILPIMLSAALAYVIRKLLLQGNIYTLRLLRRGNVIPEGLQSAVALAQTAKHVMSKTFRLVTQEELHDKSSVYMQNQWKNLTTIVTDQNSIVGIWRYPIVQDESAQDTIEAYIDKDFLLVSQDANVPHILRAIKKHNAHYAFVTVPAMSNQPDHVVGVITEHDVVESTYTSLGMLY